MTASAWGRFLPAIELLLGLFAFAAALALLAPEPSFSASSPAKSAQKRTSSQRLAASQAPPLIASYTLKARLDEQQHRISATGTIQFVNSSRAPLQHLFFHLYLNAFKNDRTLFLRSPFSAGRSGRGAREHGYIDVKRLSAKEYPGVDLWSGRALHSPGDPEDETDIEVPLPAPLPPGAKLELDLEFEAQLPAIVERTGYAGSFHFVGQWFPKLAKLNENGEFEHFPFHGQSEFYADFGRYDVTLDVPENFVVGASGERVADVRRKGRRELRFIAEPVHDFAWTAWDGFQEHRTRVDHVEVTLLAPKGQTANVAAAQGAIARALPELSRRYGAYPYRTLTVVHPPDSAADAGGMEYPTLITTGGAWYLPYTGVRATEAVTVHELAHQWFYGLLATNEARFPFLDEGLTTFAELVTLRQRFGSGSFVSLGDLEISGEALYRAAAALRAGEEPIASAASEFTNFGNLGVLVYLRTATLLETLGRVFGQSALDRALETYAHKYRFKHPDPWALIAELRAELGDVAADAFQVAVFDRGRVNYTVREISWAKNRSPAGYFERATGRAYERGSPSEQERYHTKITIYRQGELVLPVDVALIAGDGSRRLEHWDGRGSSRSFSYEGAMPLAQVVIDPEHRILIDDDLFDNSAATAGAWLVRSRERLAYFAALALGGFTP